MARDFFKNLPDKSTPLTAPRLNRMLNGEESIEKIVVGDIEGKNIFDGKLQKGVYLYADGTYSSGTSSFKKYVCSVKPTPVEAGKTLRISTNYPSYQIGFVFYNNGTFVSSHIGRTATVPDGANEFVIDIQKSESAEEIYITDIEWIQVEYGTEITDYVAFKKYGYNSEESMGKIVVDDISCKNKLNPHNFGISSNPCSISTQGYYVEYTNYDASDFEINVPYVFSFDINETSGSYLASVVAGYTDGTYLEENVLYSTNGRYSIPFTLTKNINFLQLRFARTASIDETVKYTTFANLQIEREKATEYTPYKKFDNTDSGWIDIPLANTYGFLDLEAYNGLQCKKIGNQVFIRGMLVNSVANPMGYYASCGFLPEGYRPKKPAYLICSENGQACNCTVEIDGGIRVYNTIANSWIALDSMRFFID